MIRKNVYSGTSWEKQVAYCRAKRVGDFVFVSGTVAVDTDGQVVGRGDMYEQTRFALQKIERALQECGAQLKDVVRTRMFVTDLTMFESVARGHREAFEGVDPVATCAQISGLVWPELLIEIEVDAVLGG